MAEYNLRNAHVSCLYYLYSEQNLTSTDLCERCEEDKATISRSLDYLEKNGFELLAYTLEESELARKANDKKFQADFKSAAAQQ
mgnify:CR=1 FL=1